MAKHNKSDNHRIVDELKKSKKYKFLAESTIQDIVDFEAVRQKSPKNVAKAARKRLHLVVAEYLSNLKESEAMEWLQTAFESGDDNNINEACLHIMQRHASAKERLPVLQEFYQKIFQITGTPETLADLACAVNPFSFRWMGLDKNTQYHVFDNNKRTIELLDTYFKLENLTPPPIHQDILVTPPETSFDVAFLFKMYHCLEIRQKDAGWKVVEQTPAQWLAVSFPTETLAGRKTDIFANYKDTLLHNIEENNWTYNILEFQTEKVLLIEKT